MEKVMASTKPQFADLLYQALETELGGVEVYQAALRCALRDDLKEEWTEYLEQTQDHVRVMRDVLESLGLDPATDTPARRVVRHIGESLVAAINMAAESAAPAAAQIVAAECVVLAETKDHANWELIDKLADSLGKEGKPLRGAYEQVEDEEDEHLYHTKGWSRELWIEALGLPAVLPPPEEVKDVSTAIGAARAEQSRDQMLR
jgi:ferritin-like metal-binding protein YciE